MKHCLLAVFVGLTATGCSIWEDPAPPEIQTPTAWIGARSEQGQWPSESWWRQFNSSRLNGLMSAAMSGNADISAAIARVKQADSLASAAGAPLLPQVDAGFSAQRMRSPALHDIQTVKQGDIFSPSLTASFELDFWGKNRAAQEAALAQAQVSRFDRQTILLSTQASVADVYFIILVTQERLDDARQNLRDAQTILDAFRDRLELGASTELDVAQQEAQVERQKAVIPPLEEQVRREMDALAVLTGQMPEAMPEETERLTDIAVPSLSVGLPSELLFRRPDIQRAEAAMTGAKADITVARAALLPDITLFAQGGSAANSAFVMANPPAAMFTLAGNLVQPIFDYGRILGGIGFAKARYEELIENYRKSILISFADVEDSLIAINKSTEEENAQRRALAAARHAYEVAVAQMEGGTANIVTVLIAQRDLFQTKDDLAKAHLRHLQAAVGLFKALGGGWENRPSG